MLYIANAKSPGEVCLHLLGIIANTPYMSGQFLFGPFPPRMLRDAVGAPPSKPNILIAKAVTPMASKYYESPSLFNEKSFEYNPASSTAKPMSVRMVYRHVCAMLVKASSLKPTWKTHCLESSIVGTFCSLQFLHISRMWEALSWNIM
jgi:hypothetical protein